MAQRTQKEITYLHGDQHVPKPRNTMEGVGSVVLFFIICELATAGCGP